jgi:hypothetical protein
MSYLQVLNHMTSLKKKLGTNTVPYHQMIAQLVSIYPCMLQLQNATIFKELQIHSWNMQVQVKANCIISW